MSNRGRHGKIEESIHRKFVLDCIEKDLSVVQIRKLLLDRGMNVSTPTIRAFVRKVKEEGINVTQLKEKQSSTALAINDKLKEIPELASVFGRRNFLIETLLDRRSKLLEYANEGNRVSLLVDDLNKLEQHIKDKELTKAVMDISGIKHYVKNNFKQYRPDVAVENVIRAYTTDIHEICKYVEQWTSNYEVSEIVKEVCKGLTKIAIESFGPMLKKENPEYRDKCIQKFIDNVDKLVEQIQEDNIKFGEVRKNAK